MMKEERPWGFFEVLLEGEHYKVKRIVVNPAGKLSLQTHKHRTEVWTLVKGIAVLTIGNIKEEIKEGQTRSIERSQLHRIENYNTEPLEIIEVQYGDYLGEDDILRFEDKYNRG